MRLHEWYVEKQLSRVRGDARSTVRSLYVFQTTMLVAAALGLLSSTMRVVSDDELTLVRALFMLLWVFIAYNVVRQHLYLRRRDRERSGGPPPRTSRP